MSGYKEYNIDDVEKYPIHNVPIIRATPENFKEYGNFVYDYDNEEVEIVKWPVSGWRPLMEGTGDEGGIAEGKFEYWYDDNYMRAKNHGVDGNYITGIILNNDNNERTIITREANYHPDGGQVFYPITENTEFVLLLALEGDDVKPENFVGFYFDGSAGCQIKSNIWHQPVYTFESNKLFMTKQGKVHGCVGVETLEEFNCWLGVKLIRPE